MRILHVSPAYWPFVGGAETFLQAISERLVRQGHSVLVATTDATSAQCFWDPRQPRIPIREEQVNGVRVIRSPLQHLPLAPWSFYLLRRAATDLARLPFNTLPVLDRLAPFMPKVPSLEGTLAGFRPGFDLVHGVNIALEWPLIASWRYARRHRLPFVATPLLHVGERAVQRFYTMPHQLQVLRDADRVLVLTGIEGRELGHLGVPEERIHCLGAGIDPERLQGGDAARFRARYAVDGHLVTFIGSVTDDKGAVHLVQAMRRLWSKDIRATLAIAGRPVQPSTFDRVYSGLSDSDRARIHLLGPVSDDLKQDLLAATDLFAMPSRVDSFGIVYLEAWAYGIPVIGCRAGGVPDVISDGRDGLLVEFGDQASLAAAIASLLDNAELRQAMGQQGRAKVRAKYTWDRIYEGLQSVYDSLAGPSMTAQQAAGSDPCTS